MEFRQRDGVFALGPYRLLIHNGAYVFLKGFRLLKGMQDFVKIQEPLESISDSEKSYTFNKASISEHVEILKALIATEGKEAFSPRMGFRDGQVRAIRYLAKVYGLDGLLNISNFNWHVRNKRLEVAQYMISMGANFHRTNSTAMSEASFLNHEEAARFLVANGTDVSQPSDNSYLSQAYIWGSLKTAKFLESAGAYYNGPLSPDYNGNLEYKTYIQVPIVKHLIEKGFPLKLSPFSNVRISIDKLLILQLLLLKNFYSAFPAYISEKLKAEMYRELSDRHMVFTASDYGKILDETIDSFNWRIGNEVFKRINMPTKKEIYAWLKAPIFLDEKGTMRYFRLLFIRSFVNKI